MAEEQSKPEDNGRKKEGKIPDNTVFIGNKPIMSYVISTVMQLKNSSSEVTIKARGKFISKAVDVAEVVRKRFLKDQSPAIKDIKIDTEEYNLDSRIIKVSTIDIILAK